jgi:NAD+ kinase
MKIGLLANPELKELKEIGNELLAAIGSDAEVLVDEALASALNMGGTDLMDMDADVLVTIGGDGTLLHALQRTDTPMVGINAGRLGFLTEIQLDEITEKVGRIVSGDYYVEDRVKLMINHNSERLPDCTNEAVLHTYHVSKMRHFQVLVGGQPAIDIRADGIIISTPTGSTSYAMSVGGPIIDPRLDAFVVAAIAPFNLGIRPLVIPASSEIEIRLIKKRKCVLVLDGQTEFDIEPDDIIKMERSEKLARFVRFEQEFYTKAWEKLRM